MSKKIKWIFFVLIIAMLLAVAKLFDVKEMLKISLNWVNGLGSIGIVIFILIYILACIFFLPGAILTLGAGAIFGVIKGSVIVSIASTAGATCAFLIGRYFIRNWVESKIEWNPKFKLVDDAVAKEGWKIVGLTRLSPVFPFNMFNYAYGVTKVTLRDYILASWIGMMPGTVMYVYIGSLAGDVATFRSHSTNSSAQWVIRVVGFIATVAVTIYVTRIAKKAMEGKVSQ